MQDLIFYDFDFNRILDLNRFISVNWTLNYCGYGSFEAHFPKTRTEVITILDENPYLLCIQGNKQAIITGWRIDDDIAIFGKTPEWLMTKRGAEAFSVSGDYPTGIANQVVSHSMGDFVNVISASPWGTALDYSTEDVRTVYDIVCEILSRDSIGFMLRADIKGGRFVFSTYQGTARNCVLSQANKSAHNMVYTKELQASASGIWYKARIDDTASQYQWVYHQDNPSLSGAKKWDDILSGTKTPREAQAELYSKKAVETFDLAIRRLEYGTDYSLGDIVRVQFVFGEFKKTLSKRICGIHIFCDVNNQGICPILSD